MANKINRKYHLFNAEGKTVGRLSTEIVKVLRGKHRADFLPYVDGGDIVVVTNSDKIRVTGNKTEGKIYYHFSGYPGGITATKLKDLIKRDSREVFKKAIWGMLPKNKLRGKMMTRLLVYKDDKHTHKIEITH